MCEYFGIKMSLLSNLFDALTFFLGFLKSIFLILFLTVSLPVFIFRFIVATVGPYLKPDLGEIMNGRSSCIATDYFSNKPTRANLVITSRFEGTANLQDWIHMVMNNWINSPPNANGVPKYQKFRQFPVKWLGFVFWENVPVFSVENHVELLFQDTKVVTENMVESTVEKFLNEKFPLNQSPWKIYLINNCQSGENPDNKEFLAILKIHHCLADGFSLSAAIIEGLFQCQSLKSMPYPKPKFPERSLFENILHYGTLPFKITYDFSELSSHAFENHHWCVPDSKKDWYQVYSKADPISIKTVKQIKNSYGVGFTSVILSGISAAICKTLEECKLTEKEMQVFVVLPIPGRDICETLTNKVTGTVINIPSRKFESCLDRLKAIDKMLVDAKRSTFPLLYTFLTEVLGWYPNKVTEVITKTSGGQVALTNFPGVPIELEVNGNRFVGNGVVGGGLVGDIGVVIFVLSHGGQIRIEVSAERAIMTKNQLNGFVGYITSEISMLDSFSTRLKSLPAAD